MAAKTSAAAAAAAAELLQQSTAVQLDTFTVDWSQPSFWLAVISIVGLPTAWNIVARNEYRNKIITKALGAGQLPNAVASEELC